MGKKSTIGKIFSWLIYKADSIPDNADKAVHGGKENKADAAGRSHTADGYEERSDNMAIPTGAAKPAAANPRAVCRATAKLRRADRAAAGHGMETRLKAAASLYMRTKLKAAAIKMLNHLTTKKQKHIMIWKKTFHTSNTPSITLTTRISSFEDCV
jgi:hypothetical protein